MSQIEMNLEQVWAALAAVSLVEKALRSALEDEGELQAEDLLQLGQVLNIAAASARIALSKVDKEVRS